MYPFADDYTYAHEESSEETSVTEPITVFLGTLTLTKGQQTQEISLNALDRQPKTRSTPRSRLTNTTT